MNLGAKRDKQKNSDVGSGREHNRRRGVRWWMLIAAFVLGGAVTLVVDRSQQWSGSINPNITSDDPVFATATALVHTLAAQAQSPDAQSDFTMIDPVFATGTAIIQTATAQAGSP